MVRSGQTTSTYSTVLIHVLLVLVTASSVCQVHVGVAKNDLRTLCHLYTDDSTRPLKLGPVVIMAKKTTPMSASIRSVSGASLTVDVDVKSTQVLPVGPTVSRQDSASKRRLRDTHTSQLSFLQAFGALGVPMALILVLCLAWTAWLIFVSLAPNEAANWLMNTGDYDHGQFWLIIDTNPALTMAGVVCLVIVSLSYLFVILKMLLWREKILTPATIRGLERRLLDSWNGARWESRTWSVTVGPTYRRMYSVWMDLTSFNGRNRKLWVRIVIGFGRGTLFRRTYW